MISVNAGPKPHHPPDQSSAPLFWIWAGVKVRHFVGRTGRYVCYSSFFRLPALFEAVALAIHFQNVDMVSHTTERNA